MHRHCEITLILVCLLLLGAGLRQPMAADTEARVLNKSLSVRMQTIDQTVKLPDGVNPDAVPAEITVSFPELVSFQGNDPVAAAINQAVLKRLLSAGRADGTGAVSKEKLLADFESDFQRALKENPEMIGGWFLKFDAVIRYVDEDLLCLDIMDSAFRGEAHPGSRVTFHVFSLKTGQPLELTSLVPAERAADLTKIAEQKFRVLRELKPEQSLADAGFQFADNRFALNTNFLVTRDGLVFYFNPYEIAPYGMGNTELLIPWPELKTIVDPVGPAQRFL